MVGSRPVCLPVAGRDALTIASLTFTPLEIMLRCSAAGLDFRIIPGGFNAPLSFESQRLEFLTGFIPV
jgi:hypothetical protein